MMNKEVSLTREELAWSGARPVFVISSTNELDLLPWWVAKEDVVITGVGGTNVIHHLIGYDKDIPIVNIGYAGSLDIPRGTECRIGLSMLYHTECDYEEVRYSLPGDVTCYTSNDFVTISDRKGCVFDMELAFICALGFKKVVAIKVVSDNLDYKEYEQIVSDNAGGCEV